MSKIRMLAAACAVMLASSVGVVFSGTPAFAEWGNSGDKGCTSSTYTGNANQGIWSRSYDESCDGLTTGQLFIQWNNYTGSNGDHHITWTASLSVGPLYSNRCLQIALDWTNPLGGHSDVQMLRNCREGTTVSLTESFGYTNENIDTDPYVLDGPNWPVARLQLGTYDPDDNSMRHVVCPSGTGRPAGTNSDDLCNGWLSNGAAAFDSLRAKIWMRGNGGVDKQNYPAYPSAYTIIQQTSTQS